MDEQTPQTPAPVAPVDGKAKKILLVEDDETLANVYKTRLHAEGFDLRRVPNGEEALAQRSEPGEVGFNPGLVGETGTDPCGSDPGAAVTGVLETPPSAPVPAISDWGFLVLLLLLATGGSLILRRRLGALA